MVSTKFNMQKPAASRNTLNKGGKSLRGPPMRKTAPPKKVSLAKRKKNFYQRETGTKKGGKKKRPSKQFEGGRGERKKTFEFPYQGRNTRCPGSYLCPFSFNLGAGKGKKKRNQVHTGRGWQFSLTLHTFRGWGFCEKRKKKERRENSYFRKRLLKEKKEKPGNGWPRGIDQGGKTGRRRPRRCNSRWAAKKNSVNHPWTNH